MTRLLDRLRPRAIDLLNELALRPFSLFCLLMAANAVALPYCNFFHDANLYGAQVLNRIYPGRFAGDLFFQYGSQDKFSVFSLVAAPLTAKAGLSIAFILIYVVSTALFLFALERFVRALVKDPIVSTLTLLFIAVTQIPFGGMRVFHVNEPFLTPRIPANALVLLGLERLLAGRLMQAWGLVLLALPFHPLMAFPGVLILVAWMAVARLRMKTLFVLLFLGALVAIAFLCDRPLASRWFGSMDDVWRDSVRRVNPYNFPLEWTGDDWFRIVISFIVVLTAAWYLREDAPVRRLLYAIAGTAAVGLLGGIAVCFLPYALPLQGQPYRWVWPLEFVLYPLGFFLVWRLWATTGIAQRLTAIALLAYLNGSVWDKPVLLLIVLSAAALSIVVFRRRSSQPSSLDWTVSAGVCTLAVTLTLWTAFKLGLVVSYRQQLAELLEPVELLQLAIALVDPLCRLALVVLSVAVLVRLVGMGWKFGLGCLGSCLACLLFFSVVPQTHFYAQNYRLHEADERFVAEFLAKRSSTAPPTVYWPVSKIHYLWIDLGVPSYFHIHQVVGNVFSSGNAAEGARRVQLVKRFELERLRKENLLISDEIMTRILKAYQAREDEPEPQLSDFMRLCQEKQLDFAILPNEYPGLYAAGNGRLFIYDCQALRASSHSSLQASSTPTPESTYNHE